MSTNIQQTIKPIESLAFFPPNMRYDPLFMIFSDILDKGIERYYTEQVELVTNIYNPDNPYYDPKYIIGLLGGTEIAELLSEKVDHKSISMLYPELVKQKGKEEAIEIILKIIKIDYSRLELLRDRDGCVWLTIILNENAQVVEGDLILFEKLAKKFLPTCVKLRSITNCTNVRVLAQVADYNWDLDIATHTLDETIRLDYSRIDRDQGYALPNSDLVVKLCVKNTHYLELTYEAIVQESRTSTYNYYVNCEANYSLSQDRDLTFDIDNNQYARQAFIIR